MRALALSLLLVWAGALPGAEPLAVTLRVSATAHGPNVLLGDVLDGLPEEARAIGVKASGMPGNSVGVDAALVGLKLQRAPGGPYKLEGARECQVSVGLQLVKGEQIRRFTQDYLESRLSGTAGVELKPLGLVSDLKLYDAPVTLKVQPVEDGQLRGNLVLRVQVLQDGPGGAEKDAATVPVSFLIRRHEQRLVATQVIRKGDPLGAQNLALREDDATFDDRGFASLDEVEGKIARAYVGAGKVLTRGMVEFPALIKRGDVVRVMIRSGGVIIETNGTAMRDARQGESIPVTMTETRKQLQARCVEAGVLVYEAR